MLAGSQKRVSWLCAEHGPYEAPIRERAELGRYCPMIKKRQGLETWQKYSRIRRERAERERKRRESQRPPPG